MGKLVALPGSSDLSADTILELAKGNVSDAVIVGKDKDGDLAIWTTSCELPKILWMLANAQHWVIEHAERVP
jgi:hypothetical protein